MKKRMVVFLLIFIFTGSFFYARGAEVKLMLGWRATDSGLISGEIVLPFTVYRILEESEWEGHLYRTSETSRFTSTSTNSFLRRAYAVLGMDFALYKGINLGLELSTGYFERKYAVNYRRVAEVVNEYIIYDDTSEYIEDIPTRIIPVNLFLFVEYKYRVQEWLRPYFGVGGGLTSAIFIDGFDDGLKDSEMENRREEIFVYSGAFALRAGVDFFFSKKAAVCVEVKYINPLKKNENFRNQITLGIGLRLI
jgi:opacity protein-like surface antigen